MNKPHLIRKKESDFHARSDKHLPVTITSKDWINNSLIITYHHGPPINHAQLPQVKPPQ